MEFWGIEVPSGKPTFCDPGEESYIHVSQAALGESKGGKGNDAVVLKVKVGNTEVVVGTLSHGRCDQTPLDLIFDREFVLSHNGTASSVYFCGYKTDAVKDDEGLDDEEFSESDEDTPIPIHRTAKENGKPGAKVAKPEYGKPVSKEDLQNAEAAVLKAKSKHAEKMMKSKSDKSKHQLVQDDEDEDDDEEEDDEDSDEDELHAEASAGKAKTSTISRMLLENDDDEDEDDDDDEDEDDDDMLDDCIEDDLDPEDDSDEDSSEDVSEEEQPMSAGKKRRLNQVKVGGSDKKSKLITPLGAGKQGGKIEGKTATPAPTPKQQQQSAKKDVSAKKTPGKENGSKGATPSSGKKLGQFFCQPCSKSFQTESALTQHNSAKHK